MSRRTAAFWKPDDGRSLRVDRIPKNVRVIGRLVPSAPAAMGVGEAVPSVTLEALHAGLKRAFGVLEHAYPSLQGRLELTTGHYPEMAMLPFGGLQRELLYPGLYAVTDASVQQRVLYLGSACESTIRNRLISHLFAEGRLHPAQHFLRTKASFWASMGFPDPDVADAELRRGIWGRNRWMDSRMFGFRHVAAELVAQGAFDVSAVRVPQEFSCLARCLERFATEFVRAGTGLYPPLNKHSVSLDLTRGSREVPFSMLKLSYQALDTLARSTAATILGSRTNA